MKLNRLKVYLAAIIRMKSEQLCVIDAHGFNNVSPNLYSVVALYDTLDRFRCRELRSVCIQ